jgi:uncharacterized membrane protein
MSEAAPQPDPPPTSRSPEPGLFDPGPGNVQLIYILYLVGFVVAITHLVAVVMAYISRGKGEAWLDTHYTYQIRTFWIGLLYGLISALLLLVVIGAFLMALVAVWVVVRCIKGLQAASRREPIANPTTWMF